MDNKPIVIIDDQTEVTELHLDTLTTVTLRHEATLGDLLIATLLMVLIVSFITKWVYEAIWGRK